MHTYKNLYDNFISSDNISKAIEKASKGKTSRPEVIECLSNMDQFKIDIKDYFKHYENIHHEPIHVTDSGSGKDREIYIPTFKELVIQHGIVQTLEDMLWKGMYEHSYASIPGRGLHAGGKYLERITQQKSKDIKYCLKLDIKKFFYNINHEILINNLKREIKDKKFMKLLEKIISINESDKGLPLGFYTSQWLANWYLEKLDHYIKEDLHVKYYVRYMDDMVLFCSNKRKLHTKWKKIRLYLKTELDLDLKENSQLFRFSYIIKDKNENKIYKGKDLDFMGYRFFRDKKILRKRIYKNIIKICQTISNRKYGPTLKDCQTVLSYMGWIYSSDSNYVYRYIIHPVTNLGYCKKKISRHAKLVNKMNKQFETVI